MVKMMSLEPLKTLREVYEECAAKSWNIVPFTPDAYQALCDFGDIIDSEKCEHDGWIPSREFAVTRIAEAILDQMSMPEIDMAFLHAHAMLASRIDDRWTPLYEFTSKAMDRIESESEVFP